MKIDKISYQKTFNLGNYSSERIGVDILLNEGEDAKEALATAKQLVTEYHKENNPQIYEEQHPLYNNIVEVMNAVESDVRTFNKKSDPPKLSQEETIIRDIHTCTELKTLQAYKLIAKNNPTIQEHYTAKLSELSQ